MKDKIMFSVVTPVYNCGRWVAEAVNSALGQERDDFEMIVVDDGSTDETPEILGRCSDRARIIRQENAGVSAARNRGMEEARGEWIAFLDADDRWRPGHLDRLASGIERNPGAGLVYTDVMVIDEQGRSLKPKRSPGPGSDPFRSLILANTITTSAAAVRRECLGKTGSFLPGLECGEDWDLWLRIAHRFPVVHVPEISADYRRRGGGAVHTRGIAMRDDNLLVVSRAAALSEDLPKSLLRKARANCYLESAVRLLVDDDVAGARNEALAALRANPLLPAAWGILAMTLGGRPTARAVLRWRRRRERTP
jgi:glycosyltransferase involved in cell wall biosynthesis